MIKKHIDEEILNLKLFALWVNEIESKDIGSYYKLERFVRMKRKANSFYLALLKVQEDFKNEVERSSVKCSEAALGEAQRIDS